jgi:acylphosphatase
MSESQKVRLRAVVDGLVQGVGFRQFTWATAQRMRLTGWVKNRRDRKVEIVAEGPRDVLEEFLAMIQEGPPAALVRHVNASWEVTIGTYSDFTIE